MAEGGQATEQVHAENVTVSLPAFWEEDPALWFVQAETIFGSNHITSQERRFQLIIGQLPQRSKTNPASK